jgi:8-oxo-dGTP diphosphatase
LKDDAAAREVRVLVGVLERGDGLVLIGRRPKGKHMAGYWEFPGGKRRSGERRFDALKRELAEELGIEVLEAEPLVDLTHDYPDRRVLLDVWRVRNYAGEIAAQEGQELRWVDPRKLAASDLLPADQPIIDALSPHQGVLVDQQSAS